MSDVRERIKDEVRELLPPTIFFLIAFHIIVFSRALMLQEFGVKVSALAGATIGALYWLAASVVHYLEHLVPVWWREGGFAAANHRLLSEIVWPHFWAIQLWLIVLLFVYCALREFVRVVGRREVLRMFFISAR